MSDVLCMYYSRSGNTKKAMQEIAEALDAEPLPQPPKTPPKDRAAALPAAIFTKLRREMVLITFLAFVELVIRFLNLCYQ